MVRYFFFFKQKTAYELRISDWSSDVCSSDLSYVGEDGERHRPIMLHRAIFGSYERFIGILIEHYAGKLPLWLAPVQAVVATIVSDADDYAGKVAEAFKAAGIRVETDLRNEKRSEEHTSELQSLMRISYAVFCLKTK